MLVRVKSVADIRSEAAKTKAAEYSVQASVCGYSARRSGNRDRGEPDCASGPCASEPAGHRSRQARLPGKTVGNPVCGSEAGYARRCHNGLRIGCAPDTFLGAAHQACRYAIDEGVIGIPVAGAAALLSHGMEDWHPNPAFYYHRGGGPIHDMGPYYVTQLVNLLGPVTCVTAVASTASKTRTITGGPLAGQLITVEVPTTVNGVLSFASGANVALSHSWDIWKHRRQPLEIYGSEGSMLVPDPNFFGGEPQVARRNGDWAPLDISRHAYGELNRITRTGAHVADHRIIGLLDMAAAIRSGRPHRVSGTLALHVLEVLDAFDVRRSKAVTS